MIRSFSELTDKVKAMPSKRVVIPGADSSSIVEAAIMAKKSNIADFLLIGDKQKILQLISKIDDSMTDKFEYINEKDDALCVKKAVKSVHEGKADLVLKGKTSTKILMKGVLDKDDGLNKGGVISDILVIETKKRLTLMSDGGIVLNPGVKEKVALINNAVKVGHALGNSKPKVALLSAVEVVNPKIQSTVDAAEITEMNAKGEITGCIVEGPLALDIAISAKSAAIKGINTPVAGKADILIVPNIESGNIFGKALTYYAELQVAHVVMGTEVPVLITSRADDAITKLHHVSVYNYEASQ